MNVQEQVEVADVLVDHLIAWSEAVDRVDDDLDKYVDAVMVAALRAASDEQLAQELARRTAPVP